MTETLKLPIDSEPDYMELLPALARMLVRRADLLQTDWRHEILESAYRSLRSYCDQAEYAPRIDR